MRKALYLLMLLVLAASTGCGGGSSGDVSGAFDASGGDTTGLSGSQGGDGGNLYLDGGGNVDVSTGGDVEVQFQVPSLAASFGTCKVTVTTDTTILNDEDPPPGTLYKKGGYLYEGDGDDSTDNDPQVTGLEVAAGVTLFENSAVVQTIELTRDIVIAGTVSLSGAGMNYLGLVSQNGSIWIKSTGVLTNEASTVGTGTIVLDAGGDIIMEGCIIASGRDDGFRGWYVDIYPGGTAGSAYVTGTITADGADSAGTGPGGNGGQISVLARFNAMVDATVSCDGGSGNAGTGGNAGSISILAGSSSLHLDTGRLAVTGTLSAVGGDATGGNGGAGGQINLTNSFSDPGMLFEVNAAQRASGGNASGAESIGGEGGTVYLVQSSGPMDFAGSVAVRGGQGEAEGGAGGRIDVDVAVTGQNLNLRGITALQAVGGQGDTGGRGGDLNPYADGSFTCSADIHVDGGDGVTTGGDGGGIVYSWDTYEITGEMTYDGGSGGVTDGLPGVFEPT